MCYNTYVSVTLLSLLADRLHFFVAGESAGCDCNFFFVEVVSAGCDYNSFAELPRGLFNLKPIQSY